jgi:hypothetical protein
MKEKKKKHNLECQIERNKKRKKKEEQKYSRKRN